MYSIKWYKRNERNNDLGMDGYFFYVCFQTNLGIIKVYSLHYAQETIIGFVPFSSIVYLVLAFFKKSKIMHLLDWIYLIKYIQNTQFTLCYKVIKWKAD